ncbi:peptidase S49 protein [Azorhizobium caulinodans ORS 571]|uniref:Peptidase S49 protein n=1 Tax=Azorhizobium caulinodans (strain ATCC 43989 / DSM 5975 / JCM 20966 / LMG 6465 / NBRC 14845 / NCIMB 13405 / ORS 571) TaxID=438753 RepID=A8IN85_AZOC5|nr:signal peptide peptidase SppA [Azorhizobium caulinodans]BAF89715.1 peptidase S49 protein [Azorhizobium caulinodans ORS 571]
MSLDVDQIVDRRRLRRKLTFWRVVGVLAVVAAVAVGSYVAVGRTVLASSPHVARVVIGGIIRNDRDRVKMLEEIGRSNARAVIVSIDSPGGTVTGAEQLYDALRQLAAKKPVVAVVEGMAASGGYIAAIGSDHIVSRRNAMVGSIGVIFQFPNVTDLLGKIGVTVEDIKSSPLKAAPNGYQPTSPEARAAINSLVVDSYGWFKGLVSERRKLSDARLAEVSDGRVFTGHQGLALQLVDELGDERTARAWLAREKGVPENLRVRTWKSESMGSEFGWLRGAAGALASALGFDTVAGILSQATQAAFEKAQLDGLLALWQAPAQN